MAPLQGSRHCFTHAPQAAQKRTAARRRGGLRRRVGFAAAPAAVATVGDLQQHVGQAVADVELLENSTRRGHTIARLVTTALQLIELGDLTERVAALEQRIGRRGRR
jgi:hypothetical protein